MPAASTSRTTKPSGGWGSSSSLRTSTSGPPNSVIWIARIRDLALEALRPVEARIVRERARLAIADDDDVVLLHHDVHRVLHELPVDVDLELLVALRLQRSDLAVGELDSPNVHELPEGEVVLLVGLL